MSKGEAEEMIEIEIDGQDKQTCLEEGYVLFYFLFSILMSLSLIIQQLKCMIMYYSVFDL